MAARSASSVSDPRLGVVAKRLLALDVRSERSVQPVELRKPPHDRVAPRPRRRQLVRQFGRPLARLRQLVAPLVEERGGLVLRLLRIGHRALQRRDIGLGGLRLLSGGIRGLVRLDPAGMDQPRFGRTDLVGQLAIALGGARLPPQRRRALLLVRQQLAQPREIGLGRTKLLLGILAPRMQAGNSGRLLEQQPPLGRLGRDDRADLALADQRRRMRSGGRVGEQQRHVLRADVARRRSDRRSRRRARSGG